jgi:Transcriptional regulator
MDRKNGESTERALKDAAKKLLLSCNDWTEVTARAITKEAGVNLAMINYCFGSKEALFFEVFRELEEEVKTCKPELVEILQSDMSPKEKLVECYFHMMKLMMEYYGMSQAVVKFIVMNKRLEMDDGTTALVREHFKGSKSEGECMLIAYEIASIHELLALRYNEIKETCGIDLMDDSVIRKTISENMDKYLPVQ